MVQFKKSTSTLRQQFLLEATQHPANADPIGHALAVSGDTLAIGSLGQSVRVYQRVDTGWTLRQELTTSCRASSIAIDAGVLVLRGGAPGSPGFVTIYGRSGTQWVGRDTLYAPSPQAYDNFGYALAISGSTLVATAQNLNPAAKSRGSAYLFSRARAGWQFTMELQPVGADSRGEAFGASAALDGEIAVIGAPPFAAYVFHRRGGSWEFDARLTLPDLNSANGFGTSVAVANNVIVVGDNFGSGAAVFSRSASQWVLAARDLGQNPAANPAANPAGNPARNPARNPAAYITSVSVFGNTIAVGNGAPGTTGKVLLYRYVRQHWRLLQTLLPPAGSPASFGFRVALSEQLLAVAANDLTGAASAVYEYAQTRGSLPKSASASSEEGNKPPSALHPALARAVRSLTPKACQARLLVLTPYSHPADFESISSSRMLTWGLKANGIDYTLHHPAVPRPDIASFDAVLCWAYGFKQRPAALASCLEFERFARTAGVPVINSLASFSIAHSSCLRAWHSAGIACAPYRHVNSVDDVNLPYPVILRTDGVHRGQHMHLVHSADEAERVFARADADPQLPRPNLAIQFIDTRGQDGYFRKWRSYVVGSRVVPRQLQLNTDWKVNLDGAQPLQQAIHEDQAFYLGNEPNPQLLVRAAAALGSEIVALDYTRIGEDYIFWEGNRNFDLSIGGSMWKQFCKATGRSNAQAVDSIFRIANAIASHILDVASGKKENRAPC